ncbi:MAG: ribosome maturation factor RimM [Rhodobacteraceae bacterium]|nr:ribosome maturation factor RimM [Paracoccaceae bacterium]
MAKSTKICVGAIMGSFGVKGEVRLKSFCAEPSDIASYGPLSNEDGSQSFELKLSRPVKTGFAARIKDVRYKDQADALKGVRLFVSRDVLPSLPDDEFYHSDLNGMNVVDTGGAIIGRIKAVLNHGASDLLEVTGPNLKGGILIPFTLDVVPTVDLQARRVIVDLPHGLMPGDKDELDAE